MMVNLSLVPVVCGLALCSATELSYTSIGFFAAVFNNCGNFKSFGDTKFVPEVDQPTFEKIIKASASYGTHQQQIDMIWDKIALEVYCEEDPYARVGF